MQAIAGAIRNSEKEIFNYAEEILEHLSVHCDKHSIYVVDCITELYLKCHHYYFTPGGGATPPPSSKNVKDLRRRKAKLSAEDRTQKFIAEVTMPNIKKYQRCSISHSFPSPSQPSSDVEVIVTSFDHSSIPPSMTINNNVYSHPKLHMSGHPDANININNNYENKKVGEKKSVSEVPIKSSLLPRDAPASSSSSSLIQPNSSQSAQWQTIKKTIEKLASQLLIRYRMSHDIKFHQSVLYMISQLLRNGIDYLNIDKNKIFLEYVISQILGKKSYLPHPPLILPYIFDYISSISMKYPSLVTFENVRQLTTCVFLSPYYSKSGALIPSLHLLLFNLFSNRYNFRQSNQSDVLQLRSHFVDQLILKLPQPQVSSSSLPLIIVFHLFISFLLIKSSQQAISELIFLLKMILKVDKTDDQFRHYSSLIANTILTSIKLVNNLPLNNNNNNNNGDNESDNKESQVLYQPLLKSFDDVCTFHFHF